MAANSLRLEVLMSAVDRITSPMRHITQAGNQASEALRANRTQLERLQDTQRDVASFRALKAAQEQTKTAIAANQKKMRDLAVAMQSTTSPTRAMSAEFRRAQREAQVLGQQHTTQQGQLQGLRNRLREAGVSTHNLSDGERELRARITGANSEIERQAQALRNATRQQERMTQAKERFERTRSKASSLAGYGAAGMATGGAALYAGAQMAAPQMDAQRQGALVAAQNGDPIAQAKEYESIIRGIRADGLSDDMAAIGAAVSAAKSTLGALGTLDSTGLDNAARKAMDMSAVLGGEAAENIQIVGILLKNNMAKNADEAFDLLTAGMQGVSAQMRGEMPEILQEYSTHFRGMGMDGKQSMSLLVAMAKQGKFALDKTGDAIKEFSIRGSDMSKTSVEAYKSIGLNAKTMSSAIAKGGDGARIAMQRTAKGLLGIKDPAERANAAIALFGTPVEDLAIDQIPAFLSALSNTGDTLGDVTGAADQLGKTLRDNLSGDVEKLSGSWSELTSTLMDSQNGPLRGIVQSITSVIGSVRQWSQENPGLAKGLVTAAVGVAALVAVGGALTVALASMIGPFAMVRYGMAMMGVTGTPLLGLFPKLVMAIRTVGTALWTLAANPVVLAISAIVAVIALAAYLIWKNWDTLGPKFAALWAGIKTIFEQTMGWFASLPARFTQFGSDILQGLANGITSALGFVKTAITDAGDSTIGWFKEKLGIHSPSRVFAELGGFTMQGLDQGLSQAQGGPLKTVADMAKQLTTAGTIALGASMAMPAMAGLPAMPQMTAMSELPAMAAFDNRAPLSAAPQAAAPAPAMPPISINVHPSQGMDEQALAKEVARQVALILQRNNSQQAARGRSSLSDRE